MSEELAWETLDSEIMYTCPGFEIRQDRVHLPDGESADYDYLVDDESVVIIPFTDSGELIVIEEWRQAVGRVNLGFPAGTVEPDDADLKAAAHRELTEETGYIADTVDSLLTVEPANGISNAVHHYFVAHDCLLNGTQDLDDNESIRVETTTFNRVYQKVRDGEIRDGRTIVGVLYYDLMESERP